MSLKGYTSGRQVEDAMAVLAGWIGKNYNVKVVYHDGHAVDADIFKGIIRIPRLACASGITEEALMLLRGRVYHESGHIGETELSKSEYPKKKALFSILNALEDRRMEAVLRDRFEGCNKVLNWQTDYYNKDIAGKMAEGKIDAPLWEALVAMGFMVESRRPMWTLSDKAKLYVDKAYDEFRKVKSCKSATDCLKVAKVIYELLKEANEEQKQNEPEKNEPEKGDSSEKSEPEKSDNSEESNDSEGQSSSQASDIDDEDESEGSSGGDSDEESDEEDSEDNSEDTKGNSDKDLDEDEEEDSEDNSEGSSKGEDEDDSDDAEGSEDGSEGSEGEDEGEDTSEGSDDSEDDSKGSDSSDELDDECGPDGEKSESDSASGSESDSASEKDEDGAGNTVDLDDECDGFSVEDILNDAIGEALDELDPRDSIYTALRDGDEHIVPDAADYDKQTYKERREAVSTQVAEMSRALEQALRAMAKCRKNPYMRQGKIDPRRLVQISKGLSREVFYKTRDGRKLDVAVEVIVDESGSMGNFLDVQLLAMAIGESLDRIGVPFEITGTTTKYGGGDRSIPSNTGMTRNNPIVYKHYKGFGENWESVKHRVVKSGRYNHNIDGEAVEYCAMRLAGRKETRKVIFSLSDGRPEGGENRNDELAQNLKRVCERSRESGIEVYGFGIGTTAPKKFYGKDYFIYLDSSTDMGPDVMKKFVEVVTKGEVKV